MVLISTLSAFCRGDRDVDIIKTAVRMMMTPPRTPPTITAGVVELGDQVLLFPVICSEEDCDDGVEVGVARMAVIAHPLPW